MDVSQSSSASRANLIDYFNSLAPDRDRWIKKNWYYHQELARSLSFFIPPNSSVLQVGSGTGFLLNSLNPKRGLGIDISPEMVSVAKRNHPHLEFRVDDIENLETEETFDYVVVSDVIGFLNDVQRGFDNLHRVCHRSTRILITYFHFLWEPVLNVAESVHWKAKQPLLNWLTPRDIANLLELAEFETVRSSSRLLLPIYIPLLSAFCNRVLVNLPGFRNLALMRVIVARPRPVPRPEPLSCSVVIPCRNESGNVEAAVKRVPEIGSHTEIIFVEGDSNDNTREEIERVIAKHPQRDIKLIAQEGHGKGDAVRRGFAVATGDILMILDGDLTVEPEELPKFYDAICKGTADFVHGSRLVYPMQDEAMRFLNLLGNRFFSVLFTYLLDQTIKDTLCGTKVVSKADYEKIAANRSYFGDFDPFGDFDLIFGAAKLNLRIIEIPVHYRARTYGKTNISRFRHGLLLLQMAWYATWKLKFV